MNTDFRMRVGWSTHPKFLKLENRLGDHGVLSFIRLIEWTAANKPDGTLVHMDTEDICLAARYKGDGDFVAALVSLRLLDQSGDVYRLHDWAEHNPFAAGADDRKRQAEFAVAVRWENDRRRQVGEKPMNESDKATFRIQWECSKPQQQYCENTVSIPAVSMSNTPSYPSGPSEPTMPTSPTNGESPQTPQGVGLGDDPAREVYSELKGSKRSFPPTEPSVDHAIKHLLWRVEMSNGALTTPNAIGREVKAAADMLGLEYTEDEIMGHYDYQRDRSDKGYSLHLLSLSIASLHGRAPGETKPPSWQKARAPDRTITAGDGNAGYRSGEDNLAEQRRLRAAMTQEQANGTIG